MIIRAACCLGLLAGFCCLGRVPAARCETRPQQVHFNDQPAGSLVRRLEPGPGFSVPEEGLAVDRKERWLPGLGLLLIDTTLSNNGKEAQRVKNVSVGDWTFRLGDSQDEGYRKLTYRSDVWYGSTFWTGPDWTRVGKDWHHPGKNTPSVRRFTAPRDGRVKITGRIHKLDTKCGDGVRLSIRHRGREVWKAEIDAADTKGVEPNLTLDVQSGDAVRFVVHKRGQIYCDTTHWDPVITYADGQGFQASQGFSTTRQGLDGWSYEMQAEGQPELGLPRVYAVRSDLTLSDTTPGADRPVTLDDQGALPLVVVADGADQSGIVLAADGTAPWQFRAAVHGDQRLRVRLTVPDRATGLEVKPGESVRLPRVFLGPYLGGWMTGVTRLQKLLDSKLPEVGTDQLRRQVARAVERAEGVSPDRLPELDLLMMVQADWRQGDKITETADSYTEATARHLEKARKLLRDLQAEQGPDFLRVEAAQLDQLAKLAKPAEGADLSLEARRRLYYRLRRLKRRIALANPLMDFGKLLFCKRVPTSYSHLVMQYYGWRARPGGGICILEKPGHGLACRDIFDGRLSEGNVLEPRLHWDAQRIVFSFVRCRGKHFNPGEIHNDVDEGFYHVYSVNVDGSDLRQLTRGPYDDLMPTWLPDGGIAFSSTRRRGYARCFGPAFSPRWDVYTLHRMDADGGSLRTLSFHDTNEWFPTVSGTGHVLYARWDYIDRDAVTHQNLWSSRPDGTNPVAVWGNATTSPHCTFQLQPIPKSGKIVFTASAHHSIAGGSIAVVDPTVGNNGHKAITRITPEIPFPEAEGRDIREYYTSPWPLSEKYFLVGYCPTPLVWEPGANRRDGLGIYLLDVFGNRELIYRDPRIGSTNPCPLVARPMPPVLPSTLPERAPPTGEMVLADVYQGLGDVPRGNIKQLRIVQIFPKTTPLANNPAIGLAGEENGRAILGTVPVEPDGSARFLVPAGKPILFQALDGDGFAYQTMRTVTYVQPGERISCVGCHEKQMTAPVDRELDVAALRRWPSKIDPGELGGRPFSYVQIVQPVWDKHCVRCHGGEKREGDLDLTGTPHEAFTKSYVSLCGDVNFVGAGTNPENAARALVPRFGARNQIQVTPPGGMYGALGSRLMKLLRAGHEDAELTSEGLRRLAAWIDLNAIFYGVNLPEDQARQLRGEVIPMPEIQ